MCDNDLLEIKLCHFPIVPVVCEVDGGKIEERRQFKKNGISKAEISARVQHLSIIAGQRGEVKSENI